MKQWNIKTNGIKLEEKPVEIERGRYKCESSIAHCIKPLANQTLVGNFYFTFN